MTLCKTMKNTLLIFAAILLPVGAIGTLVWGSMLMIDQGGSGGLGASLLYATSAAQVVALAYCVLRLQRHYRDSRPDENPAE